MATSTALAEDLATALGIPAPTVMHVMRGLRAAGLIASLGRGVSASSMSRDDAIALLIGLASGAPAAHLEPDVRMLMGMKLRRADRPPGFSGLRHAVGNRFFSLRKDHTFLDGLIVLFEKEWGGPVLEEEGYEERRGPLDRLDTLGITIGMDGGRSGGFAIIRGGSPDGIIRNIYSTWKVNQTEGEGLTQLFDTDADAFHMMYIGGKVLRAALDSIKRPANRERVRTRRNLRFSRTPQKSV
ncbi:hypothetical protein [Bradyrhizobium sp. WYCCWR 12699]|uniref:hypothetical protein n=1 Tax=Bradyrhizobium sp. WYCCWR 12699 TaxID=3064203 RepID=UPI0028A4003B|nr:hypothetical protein [Bradyrhizobium sp. WYCCWR 12699]MDT4738422.1 hypothetical protein [Bradyrhizobium sp. WYCCWR 12699]